MVCSKLFKLNTISSLLIKYEIMQKVNDSLYSFRDPLYPQNINTVFKTKRVIFLLNTKFENKVIVYDMASHSVIISWQTMIGLNHDHWPEQCKKYFYFIYVWFVFRRLVQIYQSCRDFVKY